MGRIRPFLVSSIRFSARKLIRFIRNISAEAILETEHDEHRLRFLPLTFRHKKLKLCLAAAKSLPASFFRPLIPVSNDNASVLDTVLQGLPIRRYNRRTGILWLMIFALDASQPTSAAMQTVRIPEPIRQRNYRRTMSAKSQLDWEKVDSTLLLVKGLASFTNATSSQTMPNGPAAWQIQLSGLNWEPIGDAECIHNIGNMAKESLQLVVNLVPRMKTSCFSD
ncbi:hypothetical protein C8J56DRAFT_1060741 [Mycena floridula]|nr:hypothetical protein C8J56DRAFT_1060741 [Mycena floridula]